MFRRLGYHSDEMLIAFAVWLCSLPLVGLIVLPLFGQTVAGVTAVVLFFVLMAICWGACTWKLVAESKKSHERR